LWISRVAFFFGLIPLLLIHPMCDCPRYFIGLSFIGVLPLLCGPQVYRWAGGAYIAAALLFAQSEHAHAVYMQKQIEKFRTDSVQQHP
jgi:hypothetical protein